MSAAPTTSEELGGAATAPALEVKDLEVDYRVRGVWREVLRGISFSVERGTSYGLVGESGCGKSTAALTAIRYLPRNGRVRSGSIEVAGVDVLGLRGTDLQRYRSRGSGGRLAGKYLFEFRRYNAVHRNYISHPIKRKEGFIFLDRRYFERFPPTKKAPV